jgi:hypothetical protein
MSRRSAAVSVAVLVLSAAVWVGTCGHSHSPAAETPPETTPTTDPPGPSSGGEPGCGLPPGNGSGQDCPRQISSYLPEVERSLDRLVERRPEIFDLNSTRGCGTCYLVRDTDVYVEEMLKEVRSEGACATWDGEELAVKRTNDFNDQYDILTFENFIRRDNGSYRATCYPAWF